MTAARLVYRTRLGRRLVCKDSDEGYDPLRLQLLEDVRRHHCLSHTARSNGRNDIAQDVVLEALLRKRLGEANERKLRSRVVCLTERAEETSSRGGADHSSVLLFPKVRPCCACAFVCSLDVNLVDEVPVRLLHVLEGDIAQDACVVDEHIDASEVVDGCLDDGIAVLDRIIVGYRLAAGGSDLVDDLVCGLWRLVWCVLLV